MASVKIGIIGGTGLEDPNILAEAVEKRISTPFGETSDTFKIGKIKGVPCVLVSRHGRKHEINPSQVNYRANIWALKAEGCTHIIVSSACGSLAEEYKPGELIFIDQFIDRTSKRESTFYDGTPGGPKRVAHIPVADPICSTLREILIESAVELELPHHKTGTMIVMEGPRYSTRAESTLYRSWGAHCIGMTLFPECVLAKELGLCYASVGLPTDYDCWRPNTEEVSVDLVARTLAQNGKRATDVIINAVQRVAKRDWTAHLREEKARADGAIM